MGSFPSRYSVPHPTLSKHPEKHQKMRKNTFITASINPTGSLATFIPLLLILDRIPTSSTLSTTTAVLAGDPRLFLMSYQVGMNAPGVSGNSGILHVPQKNFTDTGHHSIQCFRLLFASHSMDRTRDWLLHDHGL